MQSNFCKDGLTGSAWGDWSLYTASPLRAEVDEVDEPEPPFDPSKQAWIATFKSYPFGASRLAEATHVA